MDFLKIKLCYALLIILLQVLSLSQITISMRKITCQWVGEFGKGKITVKMSYKSADEFAINVSNVNYLLIHHLCHHIFVIYNYIALVIYNIILIHLYNFHLFLLYFYFFLLYFIFSSVLFFIYIFVFTLYHTTI